MSELRPCAFCGSPANQTHVSVLSYQLGFVACSKECGLVCKNAEEWNKNCEYADKTIKMLKAEKEDLRQKLVESHSRVMKPWVV